jgi:hypothetical protein
MTGENIQFGYHTGANRAGLMVRIRTSCGLLGDGSSAKVDEGPREPPTVSVFEDMYLDVADRLELMLWHDVTRVMLAAAAGQSL